MNETGLIKYDAMLGAIEVCRSVDEVKDIRDKALALEKYAQVAMNVDAEYKCAEIRVRAERKAGKLLKQMEKAKAGRPKKNQSCNTTDLKTLSNLGITKDQSSKWQRLADVPEKKFEAAVTSKEKKPSTSGLLKRNKKSGAMDSDALWLWGRIRDFERLNILDADPDFLLGEMTDEMFNDMERLIPKVVRFLKSMKTKGEKK